MLPITTFWACNILFITTLYYVLPLEYIFLTQIYFDTFLKGFCVKNPLLNLCSNVVNSHYKVYLYSKLMMIVLKLSGIQIIFYAPYLKAIYNNIRIFRGFCNTMIFWQNLAMQIPS